MACYIYVFMSVHLFFPLTYVWCGCVFACVRRLKVNFENPPLSCFNFIHWKWYDLSIVEPVDIASLQIAMGNPLVSIFLELDLQVNATPTYLVLHMCSTALNSSPCACSEHLATEPSPRSLCSFTWLSIVPFAAHLKLVLWTVWGRGKNVIYAALLISPLNVSLLFL